MDIWKKDVLDRLDIIENTVKRKDAKKYRLSQLRRLIEILNVHNQSPCDMCLNYQSSVERLLNKLEIGLVDKEYYYLIALLKNHMIKEHHYIQSGTSLTVLIVIGLIIGSLLGSYINHHMIEGIIIGGGLFALMGILQESRLEKVNKHI